MGKLVFFNDNFLLFTGEPDSDTKKLIGAGKAHLQEKMTQPALKELLQTMETGGGVNYVIKSKKADSLFNALQKNYKPVYAAGGIIQNDKKELLLIFRRGKWDLPKGKIDAGESSEEAAVRECHEETGIEGLKLKKKVGTTYHLYQEKGKKLMKVTEWFYFNVASGQQLTPQESEDITEIKWFPTKDIAQPMKNTFANIHRILSEFFDTP